MKTFAPINIVVHYPDTEEGLLKLKKHVADVRADAVLTGISKLDCPLSQKEQLLKAIISDTKHCNHPDIKNASMIG